MAVLDQEDKATDAIGAELTAIETQLDRVKQGFADHITPSKACVPLQQKLAWCVDELEKGLEV